MFAQVRYFVLVGIAALGIVALITGVVRGRSGLSVPDGAGSAAHGAREPQTIDELLALYSGGPQALVVGTFSGPGEETTEQVKLPGRPDLVEVQTSAGPKMVPPPPPPTLTRTRFTLTVDEVLVGDVKPGDQLPVVYGVPARLSGAEYGGWRVPADGDRWLVILGEFKGQDGLMLGYSVPPYWQFDVSGSGVQFAGTVPASTATRLLGGAAPAEFTRVLADAVRARQAAGPVGVAPSATPQGTPPPFKGE